MNDDTISRKQAIDALNEYFVRIGKLKRRGLNKGEKAISLDTVGAINSLPPAQPQRTGKWIKGHCSECGDHAPYWAMSSAYYGSKFCPNCGVKMTEGDAE